MKVRYINYRKVFPNISKRCFTQWFLFERLWLNKIWQFSIKHHTIEFDFRKDWVSDMTNGKVKLKDSKKGGLHGT